MAVCCSFVDELAAHGLQHAVVCPGSRSTPLAIALAAHPSVKVWVLVDERSAAFFAMGMARQMSRPVAVLCTSGTAAANFAPAVIEAKLSRIPLLVLTADRPPELRDWGAAQTIDQVHLFGSHVKWFVDMPVPNGDASLSRQARAAASRSFTTAALAPAGPVHLNFPFREPLLPDEFRPAFEFGEQFEAGRRIGATVDTTSDGHQTNESVIDSIAEIVSLDARGIIVSGPGRSRNLAAATAALSASAGYPVLADPLSGARFGAHDRTGLIDSYDCFLRDPETSESLASDVVIRVGAVPTSKALQQHLSSHPGKIHITIDDGTPRDPLHLASRHLAADPVDALSRLAQAVARNPTEPDQTWLAEWRKADSLARDTIDCFLSQCEELFEGRAALEIVSALPNGATLIVGNSMPIRDVDTFVRGDHRQLQVIGNRGANGIDGVTSSALGAAAVSHEPVALMLGDLSFYHDMNGLLAANRFGLSATIVVLNNNGGGIFSFLSQAQQLDGKLFETLFGTPIDVSIEAAAELYRCSYVRPGTWDAFQRAFSTSIANGGVTIIEIATDRQRNVELHRRAAIAVANAFRAFRQCDERHA